MTSKATFVLRIFVTMEAKLDELLKSVHAVAVGRTEAKSNRNEAEA